MKVRGILQIRNELVMRARQEMGLNQTAFGKLCGVQVGVITQLERLNFKGLGIKSIRKVAEFLGVCIEEIVPPELVGKKLASQFTQVGDIKPQVLLSSQAVHHALGLPSPSDAFLEERNKVVSDVVKTLPKRRGQIVSMYYGLGDHEPMIVSEICEKIGKSREYVRRELDRGMRALQHPANARLLEDFVEPES